VIDQRSEQNGDDQAQQYCDDLKQLPPVTSKAIEFIWGNRSATLSPNLKQDRAGPGNSHSGKRLRRRLVATAGRWAMPFRNAWSFNFATNRTAAMRILHCAA
jgi:hypothetical protein